LDNLKQTGSVTAYIGEFDALAYQVIDLSPSETFYMFKKGLKKPIIAKMDEMGINYEGHGGSLLQL
jgi:hypothetical protein